MGSTNRPSWLPGRGLLLAGAVLCAGTLLTTLTSARIAGDARALHESRFEAAADQALTVLRAEVDRFGAVGGGAAAVVQEFPTISAARYERLLDELIQDVDLEGVLGLSATFLVPVGELGEFVEEYGDAPGFDLRLGDGPDHAVIARTWPTDLNAAALGFDVFANPDAAVGLQRSLDADAAAMSDALVLQQAPGRDDGLVLYQPFRDDGGAIAGWIGVVMQGQDLLRSLGDDGELRIRITDQTAAGTRLVGELGDPVEDAPSDLRVVRGLDLYGQTWTVTFAPGTPLPASGAWLVVLGGAAATLVVALLIWRLSDAAARSWRLVDERTLDLQRANAALAQTNRELAETNRELQVASRSKDDLLSVVSHELRTPLTVIRGFAQTLRAALLRRDDRALVDLAAERIETNALRLEGVVENLLTAARLAAHGDIPVPRDVPVAELVDDAVRSWIPDGARQEVRVPAGAIVRTDPAHLRAILEQLLTNAVKYGAEPYRVEAHREHDRYEIVVGDGGAGMDPEEVAVLFDRFAQGSTGDTRTTSGVGLGLWIVREMAERNGGQVRYEREDGSRFVVSFPAGRAAVDAG